MNKKSSIKVMILVPVLLLGLVSILSNAKIAMGEGFY